ncbi:hypothetical protein TNCV_797281 [Trichonephila clavipes]|uniref:Uncharacterized protein n=1 Tax=Trichonephila clavipes TaxID=2585209 RepID=A0A8X6WI32_TRICX|nr:hypothetical protein TNCV_797281 [Trichonephila clavipes]
MSLDTEVDTIEEDSIGVSILEKNIVLQHQGEDPTGKPGSPLSAALTLRQCLFGKTGREVHQPIDRSRLTPATRLQREAWAKGIPRTPFSSYGTPHTANMRVGNQRC